MRFQDALRYELDVYRLTSQRRVALRIQVAFEPLIHQAHTPEGTAVLWIFGEYDTESSADRSERAQDLVRHHGVSDLVREGK